MFCLFHTIYIDIFFIILVNTQRLKTTTEQNYRIFTVPIRNAVASVPIKFIAKF